MSSSPTPERPGSVSGAPNLPALGHQRFAVVGHDTGYSSATDALRGSFGFYCAWDATLAQNRQRTSRPLTMPILAIGGAEGRDERRTTPGRMLPGTG